MPIYETHTTETLTHKGWSGICPVYLGNVEEECPIVVERHKALGWLYNLSTTLQVLAMKITGNYNWAFRITGEIAPREIQVRLP